MMKRIVKIGGLMLLCIIVFSCQQSMTPADYGSWVRNESNGLIQKTDYQTFSVEARFLPGELMAYREINNRPNETGSWEELLESHKDFYYFKVKIQDKRIGAVLNPQALSLQELSRRLNYYNGFVHQDFLLLTPLDTLACAGAHLERNYGLTPFTTLLVAFESKDKARLKEGENLNLLFRDQIMGEEVSRFEFEGKKLSAIPELKI